MSVHNTFVLRTKGDIPLSYPQNPLVCGELTVQSVEILPTRTAA